MPLTKSDLQQIGNILDEKLEQKLEQKFEEKLGPIAKDIKTLKKDVAYLKKTVNVVVRKYDEGDVALDRRLTRIEAHLNLPQN